MKILIFLIANLIGFLGAGGVMFYAIHNEMVPNLPDELLLQFRNYFMGGTLMVWIAGGVLSVLYLFLKNASKLFFLSLPVILPIIYAFYILNLFNNPGS